MASQGLLNILKEISFQISALENAINDILQRLMLYDIFKGTWNVDIYIGTYFTPNKDITTLIGFQHRMVGGLTNESPGSDHVI